MTVVHALLALGALALFMVLSVVLTVRLTRRVAPSASPWPAVGKEALLLGPLAEVGRRADGAAPAPAPTPRASVPLTLPVEPKVHVLGRSEAAFLQVLEAALPEGHRVFPNVRLSDLFFIATREPDEQRAVQARLRDLHVDFLVVSTPDLTPVCAIALEGDLGARRDRDAVMEVAFASARLPLVRAQAGEAWTPERLRALLRAHLAPAGRHQGRRSDRAFEGGPH